MNKIHYNYSAIILARPDNWYTLSDYERLQYVRSQLSQDIATIRDAQSKNINAIINKSAKPALKPGETTN